MAGDVDGERGQGGGTGQALGHPEDTPGALRSRPHVRIPLGKGPWSWGLWDRGSPVPCPAELPGCQAALTVTNAPNEAPN